VASVEHLERLRVRGDLRQPCVAPAHWPRPLHRSPNHITTWKETEKALHPPTNCRLRLSPARTRCTCYDDCRLRAAAPWMNRPRRCGMLPRTARRHLAQAQPPPDQPEYVEVAELANSTGVRDCQRHLPSDRLTNPDSRVGRGRLGWDREVTPPAGGACSVTGSTRASRARPPAAFVQVNPSSALDDDKG
jgi:hypothetical protein